MQYIVLNFFINLMNISFFRMPGLPTAPKKGVL